MSDEDGLVIMDSTPTAAAALSDTPRDEAGMEVDDGFQQQRRNKRRGPLLSGRPMASTSSSSSSGTSSSSAGPNKRTALSPQQPTGHSIPTAIPATTPAALLARQGTVIDEQTAAAPPQPTPRTAPHAAQAATSPAHTPASTLPTAAAHTARDRSSRSGLPDELSQSLQQLTSAASPDTAPPRPPFPAANQPDGRPSPSALTAAPASQTAPTTAAASSGAAPAVGPAQQPPAAGQQQQQQQQAHQQKAGGGRNRLPDTVRASDALIRRCGTTADADSALVLVLTPAVGGMTQQPWKALPAPNSHNPQSLNAVAELLTRQHIPLPPTPRLYARCQSLYQLRTALQANGGDDMQDGELLGRLNAAIDTATHAAATAFLVDNAAALSAATTEKRKLTRWHDVLAAQTCSMTHRAPPAAAATGAAPNGALGNPPAAGRRQYDPMRGVLQLHFATPLVCAYIAHNLQHTQQPTDAATAAPAGTAPRWRVEVHPYQRRLIAASVSGFRVGAINPGLIDGDTDPTELHGDWLRLRAWVQRAAPNCTPSLTQRIASNGKGEIEFVLEAKHKHELYALNSAVDPDVGITQPLRLTVSTMRQSEVTACSSCGLAGHKERSCPTKPTDGTRTCKRCYKAGHKAEDCTTAAAELTCALCNSSGHATGRCGKYRPRWVRDKPQPTTVTAAGQQRAPRNTFSEQRLAALQCRSYSQALAGWRTEQPAGTRPAPVPAYKTAEVGGRQTTETELMQLVRQQGRADRTPDAPDGAAHEAPAGERVSRARTGRPAASNTHAGDHAGPGPQPHAGHGAGPRGEPGKGRPSAAHGGEGRAHAEQPPRRHPRAGAQPPAQRHRLHLLPDIPTARQHRRNASGRQRHTHHQPYRHPRPDTGQHDGAAPFAPTRIHTLDKQRGARPTGARPSPPGATPAHPHLPILTHVAHTHPHTHATQHVVGDVG